MSLLKKHKRQCRRRKRTGTEQANKDVTNNESIESRYGRPFSSTNYWYNDYTSSPCDLQTTVMLNKIPNTDTGDAIFEVQITKSANKNFIKNTKTFIKIKNKIYIKQKPLFIKEMKQTQMKMINLVQRKRKVVGT